LKAFHEQQDAKPAEKAGTHSRVQPYHFLLFFSFLFLSFLCSRDVDRAPKRTEWMFLNDSYLISATPKGERYSDLKIECEEGLIYEDQLLNYVTNFGTLPIARKISGGRVESLLGWEQNGRKGILRLISLKAQLMALDTLPMFIGSHHDLNGDGRDEFMGYRHNYPPFCEACDSVYYNPLWIYQMTDDGFSLDSLETQKWIHRHYSSFHGFQPDSNRVVGYQE